MLTSHWITAMCSQPGRQLTNRGCLCRLDQELLMPERLSLFLLSRVARTLSLVDMVHQNSECRHSKRERMRLGSPTYVKAPRLRISSRTTSAMEVVWVNRRFSYSNRNLGITGPIERSSEEPSPSHLSARTHTLDCLLSHRQPLRYYTCSKVLAPRLI